MARNTKSCFTVACLLWLLVLFMGSSLLASEARPLSNVATDSASEARPLINVATDSASEARPLRNVAADSVSGNAMGNGIEALIERLYVEAIKAGGGPNPGGKGHGSPGVTFKNSGPNPGGKGHAYPSVAFKNSGPSPGNGH